jgi:ankyrin repeat protein
VFAYLLEKGADVDIRDTFGRTPLHEWSCVSDGINRGPPLENLLEVIDVNSVDCKRQTPLHVATAMNTITKVEQLLKHGGDREARDINGITPLYIAKHNSQSERVLHMLLDYPNQSTEVSDSHDDARDTKHVYMSGTKTNTLIPYLHDVYQEMRSKHNVSAREDLPDAAPPKTSVNLGKGKAGPALWHEEQR